MITSVKYNPGLYDELFAKADARLREVFGDSYNDGWGDTSHIESIEEYFSHLKDLVEGKETDQFPTNQDEISKRFIFLRLPLDEPPVWINANTRTISKKIEESGYGYWENGSFKEYKQGSNHPFFINGIAVQGDEVAETVYFEVDRFFDAMDLNLTDIAVQWIHEDDLKSNIQPIYNYTPIIIKDIESQTGKLIFGWPIGSEITERPGKIHFSIRFYQTMGNEIVYSLSTQTSVVTVNPTILADVASEYPNVGIDNKIDLIRHRLQNSIFTGAGDPELAYYIFTSPNQNDIIDGGDIKFYCLAQTRKGQLSYKWMHFDNDLTPDDLFDSNNVELGEDLSEGFHSLNSEEYYDYINAGWLEGVQLYYRKNEDDSYEPIRIENEENYEEDLMIKCSVFSINADDLIAGLYRVNVESKYYNNTLRLYDANRTVDLADEGLRDFKNHYWQVAGPKQPAFNDNNMGLKDNSIIGETLSVHPTNVDENTNYYWTHPEGTSEGNNTNQYNGTSIEGFYSVMISNTKNQVTKSVSSQTFVYEPLKDLTPENGFTADNIKIEETEEGKIKIYMDLEDYSNSLYNEYIYNWGLGSFNTLPEEKFTANSEYCIIDMPYSNIVGEASPEAEILAYITLTLTAKKIRPNVNNSENEIIEEKIGSLAKYINFKN